MNMHEHTLIDTSYAFTLAIVTIYRETLLPAHETALSGCLVRNATTLGLQVREAFQGNSWHEGKLSLARQQAREASYHLRLLHDSGFIGHGDFLQLNRQLDQLTRQLTQRNTPLFSEH